MRTAGGRLRRQPALLLAACLTVAAIGVAASAIASNATSVSVVITPGELQFIGGTPSTVSFNSIQLNGLDQNAVGNLHFNVSDATGLGLGWRIEGAGSAFIDAAGYTLPDDATSIQSTPITSCDLDSGCVVASDLVQYPYLLPSGPGATATTLFDAAAGTGMGNETVTPTFTLTLPASTPAASYTATWSFTLVSGP